MSWKSRGRAVGLLTVLTAFIAANSSFSIAPAAAGQGGAVVAYSDQDDAMNAAQSEARRHLSQFLDHVLRADGAAQERAGIKVALPVPDGGHEVVWVAPFDVQNGRFVGVLANHPNALPDLAAGDSVSFDESQVRDWYIMGRDGRMYGSYTTRAMLPDLTAAGAAQIAALLSVDPLPANW